MSLEHRPTRPRAHRSLGRAWLAVVLAIAACGGPQATATPSARTSTPTPAATATPSATTATPTAAPTTAPPGGSPTTRPSPTRGPAASCAIADALTPFRGYADYARTVLDTTYRLDATYAPPDLVHLDGDPVGAPPRASRRASGDQSLAELRGDDPDALLRAIVLPDLGALRDDAARAGVHPVVVSAYRSYEDQRATFDYWVSVGGYEAALATSARAGHSEHQLGTTVDLGDGRAAPWEFDDFAATPTGAWLAAHAWEYGFVMSYPAGRREVTCYDYEPWHYRWVGRDVAAKVHASGLTLREYLERAG